MSFAERGEVKHAYRMDEIVILEDEKEVQILELPHEGYANGSKSE